MPDFLAITLILILAGSRGNARHLDGGRNEGLRAGLITVAGTSTGNALLLISIALGLNWVLSHAVYVFELLRWAEQPT